MSRIHKAVAVVIGALGIGLIVMTNGPQPQAGTDDTPAGTADVPQMRFTRWTHASGLFSTEVPEGWRIDGSLGDALDQGQFRINADAPDGRSHISFGHNWLSFMEFQHGPYRPGAATVETLVLPAFLQAQRISQSRVVYRSANRRISMPTQIGVPIPFDAGTVGFLMRRVDGGYSAGTAMGETMFIASPGTPGLWRLRLFAAAVAPADAASQAAARTALTRLVDRLELSPQFHQLWNEGFQQTQQQMRAYSRQMDQVFSGYLRSVARASSRSSGGDPAEDWATMMRGGQFGQAEGGGDSYWITNEHKSWWVNDQGVVHGNDTGAPPADNSNWRPLVPRGQ